jgi:hypothetical protein
MLKAQNMVWTCPIIHFDEWMEITVFPEFNQYPGTSAMLVATNLRNSFFGRFQTGVFYKATISPKGPSTPL